MSKFISLAATGTAREVAAFGTRGDGKTQGAFGCMITHAQMHAERGYPLPTKWLGAADTFASHTAKTLESLAAPFWLGAWRLEDGGHVARFIANGVELVQLRLFGVEDQSGMDRLRAECHGLWFEEPAPASVLVQSSGLSETAWGLGRTSQRLPSHAHPAIMTLNYPDEEHWTWERFVVRRHPGTAYVRIPPGERASEEQRAEWREALADRPDMLRRLLEGKPGTVLLGPQVAVGFDADVHAPTGSALRVEPGVTLWCGQDGGLTPATVIGQRQGARVRVLAALCSQHDGIKQHVRSLVKPWLSEHAPWALNDRDALQVIYDPSMNKDGEGDTEANALKIMRAELPGVYRPGPTEYPLRLNPILGLFNAMERGTPCLQIDPVGARGLVKALGGGWHYPVGPDGKARRKDEPVKNHPHSDFGDAFSYLVAGMAPGKPERDLTAKPSVRTAFDAMNYERGPRVRQDVPPWAGPRVLR